MSGDERAGATHRIWAVAWDLREGVQTLTMDGTTKPLFAARPERRRISATFITTCLAAQLLSQPAS